jgi:hypothetical protein
MTGNEERAMTGKEEWPFSFAALILPHMVAGPGLTWLV